MSDPDQLVRRRARAVGHPSTFERDLDDERRLVSTSTTELEERIAAAEQLLVSALADVRRQQRATDDEAEDARLDLVNERVLVAVDRVAAARERLEVRRMLERSHRDGLTGLLSRDVGLELLAQELDRARREGTDLTVAFLDVDGLKQVNDQHGHLVGDAVLRALGSAIVRCLRRYDLALRYGGDEFVCALPGVTAEAAARFEEVAEVVQQLHPGASFSVGLALAFRHDDCETVLARADADLLGGRQQRTQVVDLDDVRSRTRS